MTLKSMICISNRENAVKGQIHGIQSNYLTASTHALCMRGYVQSFLRIVPL